MLVHWFPKLVTSQKLELVLSQNDIYKHFQHDPTVNLDKDIFTNRYNTNLETLFEHKILYKSFII